MFEARRSRAVARTLERARRRVAGLAAGVAVAVGALLGTAVAPAQAYSPDPSASISHRDTDTCPCSLSDPFDGTYFRYDADGEAAKVELRYDGWYIGKIEFHPYDEQLWVYDTKNDGDTFYTEVFYIYADGGTSPIGTYSPPGTDNTVDYRAVDLNLQEHSQIGIRVYDDRSKNDWITSTYGVA